MRKILFLFSALLFISAPFVYSQDDQTTGAGGMQFYEGSWSEVLAAAKEQNKYIFVDAFADWCVPCKWMAKNVFPTEEAGKFYNEHFIVYKLDMEKGEGIDFAKTYHVNAYPTYLYFNPSGELVHISGSSKPLEKFIEDGKNALDKNTQLMTMKKKYDDGDRSEELLYNYAFALARANAPITDMSKVTLEYLDTQKDEDLASERNWKIIANLLLDIKAPAFIYLENNKEKFASLYGAEMVSQKITNTKIEYFKEHKDWDSYSKVVSEYADNNSKIDWQTLNDFAWTFYENVSDKEMMKKAEKWIKRSVELDKNYYNTDTYASVLYKLGKYDEALNKANEAIELAKKSGDNYKGTEELIKKINKQIED